MLAIFHSKSNEAELEDLRIALVIAINQLHYKSSLKAYRRKNVFNVLEVYHHLIQLEASRSNRLA
jgi:hypothetical protein